MIASEYGFTLEQFGNMTTREVFMCCKKISERLHRDFKINASIHGATISEEKEEEKVNFTEDQDKFLDSVNNSAMETLAKRREALNVK